MGYGFPSDEFRQNAPCRMVHCGFAQKFDLTLAPLREIWQCYGPDNVEIKARPRAFIQPWTGVSGSMCDATYTHSCDAFRWTAVRIEGGNTLPSNVAETLPFLSLSPS